MNKNTNYLSKPSVICAGGNSTYELLQNVRKANVCLQKEKFLKKEFLVGKCENLISLPDNTPKIFNTRTNKILYNALLPLESLIFSIVEHFGTEAFGVCIGTSTTGVEENLDFIMQGSDYIEELNALCNPAIFVKNLYSLQGPCFGISSACTSGVKAIVEASRLIDSQMCEAVICGGVDSLSTLTLNGFASLEILSASPSTPFCAQREGINIGEGAGVFVVASKRVKEAFDKDFSLQILGYGSNNDAFHITQPSLEQASKEAMLKDMFKMSELDFNAFDYINLHGTGTKANDSMEAEFISTNFPKTPASTIKPYIGHTLAAAGAIETALCAELILDSAREREEAESKNIESKGVKLPAHIFEDYDSALPNIHLVKPQERANVKNALSTSFAFGGDNAIIALGACHE